MISLKEYEKRLGYINSQSLELRDRLKPRINDSYFWDYVKQFKPEENGKIC